MYPLSSILPRSFLEKTFHFAPSPLNSSASIRTSLCPRELVDCEMYLNVDGKNRFKRKDLGGGGRKDTQLRNIELCSTVGSWAFLELGEHRRQYRRHQTRQKAVTGTGRASLE